MTIDQQVRDALIDAVRRTAKAEVLPHFRNLGPMEITSKSNVDDMVTEADRRAEAAIKAAVAEIIPDSVFIGEEAVANEPRLLREIGRNETTVILDPIDGTWNFVNGLATFGIILALSVRSETVFGLLYDPVMDDWVVAHKGEGAWFCQPGKEPRRLEVGPGLPTKQMLGILPLFLYPKSVRPRLSSVIHEFRRVMWLGCACHEYRLQAFSHADFSVSSGKSMPWDHAAGVLIVEEAGGHASFLDGEAYSPTRSTAPLVVANTKNDLSMLCDRFGFLLDTD